MKTMTSVARTIAMVISTSAVGFACPAIAQIEAQGADSSAANDALDIIVTAQRRSEGLQSVPVAVSVVTGDTLERANITQLEQVSMRMPAVVIRSTPGGDQIFIRGAGSGFNSGFEQSVATFVDGVYRPRARSSRLGLFDTAQIEILKGPQTIYFGANAIAGALNITTRRPGQEFGAKETISYSPEYDEYNAEVAIDAPVNDTLAFRVVGGFSGRDAYTYNARLQERGQQRRRQARVSMLWTPDPAVEVFGRFDYGRVRNTADTALEIIGCPPPASIGVPPGNLCQYTLNITGPFDDRLDRRNSTGFMDIYNMDFYEGVVTGSYDFGTGSVISTTAYQDQRAFLLSENANFPAPGPNGTAALIPANLIEHHKQFSQELRVQSDLGGMFEYMVGGYYEHGTMNNASNGGYFHANFAAALPTMLAPGDIVIAANHPRQKTDTLSAYATADLHVTSMITATAGLRYSRVRKQAVNNPYIAIGRVENNLGRPELNNLPPAPQAVQDAVHAILGNDMRAFVPAERTDSEWIPSLKLTVTPSTDFMGYLSYSHGFKAGGYSLQSTADVFGPETVDSYEGGIKASWFANRLITNIAVFQANYKGLQESGTIYSPSGTPLAYVGNVGKVRTRGVEFSGMARLTDQFTLHADVAYLDSKYTDYRNAPCSPLQAALAPASGGAITCPNDLSGQTRANSPKWSGSVGASYDQNISSNLALDAGLTVYFRSKYYLQAIPEEITSQSGFAKADFNVGLSNIDNSWRVEAFATNITNKLTSAFAGHAPASVGTAQRIADPGRTIGLRVTLRQGGAR